MILAVIGFIVVFGILVFVHELGHFAAAKFFGVKVEEFAFGFPPRIWSKKRGDTTYAINVVPIGGYVKMLGEEGEGNKKDTKNFNSKKAWQKTIILSAGVIMNLALAYVLLTGFYLFGGRAILPGMEDHKYVENTQKVTISEVVPNSPASKNELKAGDVIVSVNGTYVQSTFQVVGEIQNSVKADKNKAIPVIIERDGVEIEKTLNTYTYVEEVSGKNTEYQRIGITMENEGKLKAVWYAAPLVAAAELRDLLKLTVVSLGNFLKTLFSQFRLSEDVGGPVSIFYITGTAISLGLGVLVQVVIVLSLTLAIINILPFPALDGGHIFFLAIEKLFRKEIPQKVKENINRAGFFLLIFLMIAITFKDLGRFGIITKVREWFS